MLSDFDLSDSSKVTELDEEIKRALRSQQPGKSEELHRLAEQAFAEIDAILKRYEGKGLTREHLSRLMLSEQETDRAGEKLYGHRQVNVGDIRVTGHVHITRESEEWEKGDV